MNGKERRSQANAGCLQACKQADPSIAQGFDIEIDIYPLMSSQMPAPKLRSDRRTPEFSSFHCEARM
jgi:hypothetical protein